MSFAEASAMKLYSTNAAVEVASEVIQLFGGNGYMAEYKVEQLYRDARVMRIYAGTDEMQVRAIARDLLTRWLRFSADSTVCTPGLENQPALLNLIRSV